MGSEIIVKRLFDYELVLGTMDVIWGDISEDGQERYKPDLLNEYWLGLFMDGEYLGMYRFHSLTSAMLEGHVFMLPEKRQHSYDCGLKICGWLIENLEFNRVSVNIPDCFKNVISFVEKLGLTKHGYISNCFLKNGGLIGLHQYSIEKVDMKWVA
jgi:hypothetical protein